MGISLKRTSYYVRRLVPWIIYENITAVVALFDCSILLLFMDIILTIPSSQLSSINSVYSYPLHVLTLFVVHLQLI
jgi:hypothetical protein